MSRHEEHAQNDKIRCHCPVCQMMRTMAKTSGRGGPFWNHLTNARIEVLRAVRSLIDERIDQLEKKKNKTSPEKKAEPIQVE
ncbi:hypothetical protein [Desulfosoma caldarium]|uniref:Uncharacterized protein n=1 Tax=Desulfosoma caldarium TaxID=610254 RepID=A0A3N1UMB4_9BACT|nr:hypothetical protein [Desulfosoma caldarium]ROQ89577.1 hypothetical protein EDC27_3114 [Desulfosoma caldarium]